MDSVTTNDSLNVLYEWIVFRLTDKSSCCLPNANSLGKSMMFTILPLAMI